MEIDGVNLTRWNFNENNEKKLEIKFLESKRKDDDKLFMKKITATIFKADKLDKDIHISADSGYAKNNFYDFFLQDNARISSPSFTLASKSFDLNSLDFLTTKAAVAFKLSNVSGQAKNGLLYYINKKYMKMFQPKGIFIRAGKSFNFQAQILRVVEKKNMLFLDRDAKVDGDGTAITGDRISLQFDQDFANLEWAATNGKCYFKTIEIDKNDQQQSKEINSDMIKMNYDPEGRPQQIIARGAAKLILATKKNSSLIESDTIEIALRSETQTLDEVRSLTRGKISNHGQDNVTVNGDSLLAAYSSDGILAGIKAEKNCEFSTDDFQGTAAAINYDAAKFLIDIAGNDATIISKKNIFKASNFLILTRRRQLSSDKSVRATVIPEKNNVLFKAKPIFVTAAGMEMTDKGNSIRFKEKVKLFQDDIELHAGEMLFDNYRNLISCQGTADLKFLNENELVVIRGQTILFNTPERKIVIVGDAKLNQAENILGGRQIELSFGPTNQLENISALDNATFSKKDLSGQSLLLDWDFKKKIISFKNSAQITRKGAGTTKGKELLLNLSTNEIKISSRDDRAETIINQD